MIDFFQTLTFNFLVLTATAGVFYAWYQRRIGKAAKRREFQYRIFALRDRAVRLIAEGKACEEDADWQAVYRRLNESADAVRIEQLQSISTGVSFVLLLLKRVPAPNQEERKSIHSTRQEIENLWKEYARTVVRICYESSLVFRLSVAAIRRISALKRLALRWFPVQTKSFRSWECAAGVPA